MIKLEFQGLPNRLVELVGRITARYRRIIRGKAQETAEVEPLTRDQKTLMRAMGKLK
jgi:hypothetical protein